MGSIPITTSFYEFSTILVLEKQNQVMSYRRNTMNYRTKFSININRLAKSLVETVTTLGIFNLSPIFNLIFNKEKMMKKLLFFYDGHVIIHFHL